jgi:hypothetical protein
MEPSSALARLCASMHTACQAGWFFSFMQLCRKTGQLSASVSMFQVPSAFQSVARNCDKGAGGGNGSAGGTEGIGTVAGTWAGSVAGSGYGSAGGLVAQAESSIETIRLAKKTGADDSARRFIEESINVPVADESAGFYWLLLEAGIALGLLLFIVWWTMKR